MVFYLPAESGEKITLAVTILNCLNIFLLLVSDINPPTSLATPLICKYLLFVMALVTCSIMLTILVINIHFRSPSTHDMSPWVKGLFLKVLPRLLFMQRPQDIGRYSKVSFNFRSGVPRILAWEGSRCRWRRGGGEGVSPEGVSPPHGEGSGEGLCFLPIKFVIFFVENTIF